MDPNIWSALPKDLVQRVFAHLPVAHIFRLQVLSKEWNQNVTARESEFRRVCAANLSKIFGLVAEGDEYGQFVLLLFDIKSQKWHIVESDHIVFRDRFPESFNLDCVGATDGGLVCLISRLKNKEANPLTIMVCNPLLAEFRQLQLPSGALRIGQPRMIQLLMDSNHSKDYKVTVVGTITRPGTEAVVAEIYHSASETWTSAESFLGVVFGEKYQWNITAMNDDSEDSDDEVFLRPDKVALCVLDCASSQLLELRDFYPSPGKTILARVLVKDRLFLLLDGSTEQRRGPYTVTEYQGQNGNPRWRKVREYTCSIEHMFHSLTDKYNVTLFACEGILLICASINEGKVDPHSIAQYCELSTGIWHDIPGLPVSFPGVRHSIRLEFAMC